MSLRNTVCVASFKKHLKTILLMELVTSYIVTVRTHFIFSCSPENRAEFFLQNYTTLENCTEIARNFAKVVRTFYGWSTNFTKFCLSRVMQTTKNGTTMADCDAGEMPMLFWGYSVWGFTLANNMLTFDNNQVLCCTPCRTVCHYLHKYLSLPIFPT